MEFRNAIIVWTLLFGTWSATPTLADELDWLVKRAADQASVRDTASEPTRLDPLPIRKVGGALAVVLGGFFLITLLLRKQPTIAANQLLESLGSVQIAPKVHLHLVRLGTRLLVLHISGQNVQRVAELDNPEEVERLLKTRQSVHSNALPVSVHELLDSVHHNSIQR